MLVYDCETRRGSFSVWHCDAKCRSTRSYLYVRFLLLFLLLFRLPFLLLFLLLLRFWKKYGFQMNTLILEIVWISAQQNCTTTTDFFLCHFTITSMFQKKRPDRRAFAIEQGPHTYVGEPLEDQSAYTTHACGKERKLPPTLSGK